MNSLHDSLVLPQLFKAPESAAISLQILDMYFLLLMQSVRLKLKKGLPKPTWYSGGPANKPFSPLAQLSL